MAKIPIFTPDFRTFTQVYPYMQTENELAARDTSGKLLPSHIKQILINLHVCIWILIHYFFKEW